MPASSKREPLDLEKEEGKRPKPRFVDEIPDKWQDPSISWSSVLNVLVRRRHRWALIYIADSPADAQATQKNLAQRKVKIPFPDHEWEFVSRRCDVFAIYRGPSEEVHTGKDERERARRAKHRARRL